MNLLSMFIKSRLLPVTVCLVIFSFLIGLFLLVTQNKGVLSKGLLPGSMEYSEQSEGTGAGGETEHQKDARRTNRLTRDARTNKIERYVTLEGHLSSGVDVNKLLTSLSDDELISLLARLSDDDGFENHLFGVLVGKYFATSGSPPDRLAELLVNKEPNHTLGLMIRSYASSSSWFSPTTVDEQLSQFPDSYRAEIVYGILKRTEQLELPEILEIAKEYMTNSSSSDVVGHFEEAYVRRVPEHDLESMENRLLLFSEDINRPADSGLVRRYNELGRIEDSIRYINMLLDEGNFKRAGASAREILNYEFSHPAQKTEWAFSLPPEIPNRDSIASISFMNWYRNDREAALAFLERQPVGSKSSEFIRTAIEWHESRD